MAVTKFDHYPHHALIKNKKKLTPVWPKLLTIKNLNIKNFNVMVVRMQQSKLFFKIQKSLGPKLKGYEMPRYQIDLDEFSDYSF